MNKYELNNSILTGLWNVGAILLILYLFEVIAFEFYYIPFILAGLWQVILTIKKSSPLYKLREYLEVKASENPNKMNKTQLIIIVSFVIFVVVACGFMVSFTVKSINDSKG